MFRGHSLRYAGELQLFGFGARFGKNVVDVQSDAIAAGPHSQNFWKSVQDDRPHQRAEFKKLSHMHGEIWIKSEQVMPVSSPR